MAALRSSRSSAVVGLLLAGAVVAQQGGSPRATPPVELPPRPPVTSRPPDPPTPSTPVDNFRRLLVAGMAERESILQSRSKAQRDYLVRQLADFDSLTAAEREARLRLLEFRYYLVPLLGLAPADRATQLLLVPTAYRAAVRDRLQAWDSLPPDTRAALVEEHAALQHLLRFPGAAEGSVPEDTAADPAARARFDRAVARLRGMDAGARQALAEHLQRFFQFSDVEQQRALAEVDAGARARLERLVAELDELPAPEREQCLESLKRFTQLPLPEQERFLRNALRWAAMSPEDRRAWRQLHAKLPPMPPELPPSPAATRARHQAE